MPSELINVDFKNDEKLYEDILGDMLKQAERDIKRSLKDTRYLAQLKRRGTIYDDILGDMLKEAEDDIKKTLKFKALSQTNLKLNETDDIAIRHKLPYQLLNKYLNKVLHEVHFTNGIDKLKRDEKYCLLYKNRFKAMIEVPSIGVDANNLDFGENVLLDIDPESTKLPFFCKTMIVNQGKTHERSDPKLVREVCLQIGEPFLKEFTPRSRPVTPRSRAHTPRQRHLSRHEQSNQDPNVSFLSPTQQRPRTCSWSNMEEYYSIPHYQYSGRRKPCMNTGMNTSVTIDCTTVDTEIEPDNEPHNCSISIDTNDLIEHLDCKVFSKVQLMSPYTLNGSISEFKTKSIISQPSELRLKKRKVKKLRFLMVPEHKTVNELSINLNGIADAGDDEEFYMIRDMNTDTDDFIFYLSEKEVLSSIELLSTSIVTPEKDPISSSSSVLNISKVIKLPDNMELSESFTFYADSGLGLGNKGKNPTSNENLVDDVIDAESIIAYKSLSNQQSSSYSSTNLKTDQTYQHSKTHVHQNDSDDVNDDVTTKNKSMKSDQTADFYLQYSLTDDYISDFEDEKYNTRTPRDAHKSPKAESSSLRNNRTPYASQSFLSTTNTSCEHLGCHLGRKQKPKSLETLDFFKKRNKKYRNKSTFQSSGILNSQSEPQFVTDRIRKCDMSTQVDESELPYCTCDHHDSLKYAVRTDSSNIVCGFCKRKLKSNMENANNQKKVFDKLHSTSQSRPNKSENPVGTRVDSFDIDIFNLLSDETRRKYNDKTQIISYPFEIDHYFRLRHDRTLKMYLEPIPAHILSLNLNTMLAHSLIDTHHGQHLFDKSTKKNLGRVAELNETANEF